MSAAAVTEAQPKVPFKVAISSFLGNFIEWFDYATYTYFAITIGIVFFPESAVNSTLLAFAVFALSFVFRPLGAAFWGSMGDKKGRKWSLSLSIFMMTGAAFLIGCLPSYETIGLLSPILLLCLRSVQGFSAAGEYSGAAVFLAEYAPANHRGKYCSLVPASTAAGLLAGSTAALIIKALLPEADVISWGWRIPFLLAGPLGLVAHYIRTKLEDSPTYQQMTSTADPAKEAPRPTRLVFKKYKKRLATSIAATMVNSVGFYLVLTYLPTYLTSYTAMKASAAQLATDIALVTYIFIIFGAGKISDIVGRKKMLLGSCVAFILLSIPAFMMLETAQLPIVIAAELIMCVTLSFNDANIACYQAEMFHGSALHRRRAGVEHRLRGVRRHGLDGGHRAHRRHGQRPHARVLYDGHLPCGGHHPAVHGARVRRQGIERHRVEDRTHRKRRGSGKGRVERPFPRLRRVGALARLRVAIPCATARSGPWRAALRRGFLRSWLFGKHMWR